MRILRPDLGESLALSWRCRAGIALAALLLLGLSQAPAVRGGLRRLNPSIALLGNAVGRLMAVIATLSGVPRNLLFAGGALRHE